ncbi:hypothetical protein P9B03_02270 [Metasolibacillus meyeri]|uniref:Uncharacterized protein n=1 Tax=Metasolibacillus meyeri TaxID=1071052 RepID=A0AAW9NRA1_9BACL|nr:hypothetical protein [Metasolibacillus meyeri]MEC1177296.1 hypothetical protein [Metasolibacillus meyeri]
MNKIEKFKKLIKLCEERERVRQPDCLFSIAYENTATPLTKAINAMSKELGVLSVDRGENGLEIFLSGGLQRLQTFCEDEQEIEYKTITNEDENTIYHCHGYKIKMENFYLSALETNYIAKQRDMKQKPARNFERE